MASIIGSALTLPSASGSSGGGSGVQAVYLPPSSLFNAPTTWTADNAMSYPSGYDANQCIVKVRGDSIYVIGNGQIKIGNLRNRTWEEETVATGMGFACSACWYDDYKLLIFEAPVGPRVINGNGKIASFNSESNIVSYLGTYTYSFLNKSNALPAYNTSPSVFVPAERAVYFYLGVAGSYYNWNDDSNYEHYSTRRLFKYDIDLNTIEIIKDESYATSSGSAILPTEASNARIEQRSVVTLFTDQTKIKFQNGALKPTTIRTVVLDSKTVTDAADSVIPYSVTAWCDFGKYKLMFNGNAATLYDPQTNQQVPIDIPPTPVTPTFASLFIWDNQVCYLGASALYSLPYVAKADSESLANVWTILKGQEYCGMEDLTVLDSSSADGTAEKLKIRKDWQTALSNIDIKLGEYDAPFSYRLLVRNKIQ